VEPAPRFVELARGFEPTALLPLVEAWQRADGLAPEDCRSEAGVVRVRHPLPRAAWTRTEDGAFRTPLPGGAFRYGLSVTLRLRGADFEAHARLAPRATAPPTLELLGQELVLRLEGSSQPGDDWGLEQRLESGNLTSEGRWQVRSENDLNVGIPVWSGRHETVTCDVPAESALSCRVRYSASTLDEVRLVVRLDGELVHELRAPSQDLAGPGRWLRIPLPRSERRAARLEFSAEGPPGQAQILHPILGPREIGNPGARPWNESRPDIVLFLADTLRADALALGGGPEERAPALNAWAQGARRFPNARSNAAWTLPSISTALTGLAPGQHTANAVESALPAAIETIVESLAHAGYRTGAVTDAAFFSPSHGLEQGFETFGLNPPSRWKLARTLATAGEFLSRDDGRPLFLVVHTYRTHMPFRVGPEEDLRPWKELTQSGCIVLRDRGRVPLEQWIEGLERCRERYAELYWEGVRALDQGFASFLETLSAHGLDQTGTLIFTSDHGEALGENQDLFHDGKLWDAKLRIPLCVRGPGIEPGTSAASVTLLDLTPTLAALAGLAPRADWAGRSLLVEMGARPALAFRLKADQQITLEDQGRKLFAESVEALERGEFDSAYDLRSDPREERPVVGEPWPTALARRHAPLVRALLQPATLAIEVPLSEAQRRELGQLGYGGDEGMDPER
jgi:arylsulfatase A-like enzyme